MVALVLLVTALGMTAAGCRQDPSAATAQPGPAPDGSTTAPIGPVPDARPPGTTRSPSVRASNRPPTSSSPAAPVRDVDWYLDHLPRFRDPPDAKAVTLPHQPGQTPWITHIPTDQKVAFLTIDDGWIRRPEALRMLRAAEIPVTLFLVVNAAREDPGYFRPLQQSGAVIEAHTITHARLPGLPYEAQKHEICGSADWLADKYGRHPVLFRPPYGEKDATTLTAAYDCGMKATVYWTETVDKGHVYYQTGEKRVHAGDIILMHFREAYAADFWAALTAIRAAGLVPALLEDYVRDVHSEG